jgi:malate dehydrogenase (oxaloacetate-decarboxylating)(NADP+)
MKMAAANALAKLAREPVPLEVLQAYNKKSMTFGKEYIIPTPFDPRLITVVSTAVARTAIETGVAKKNISDWAQYERELKARVGNNA